MQIVLDDFDGQSGRHILPQTFYDHRRWRAAFKIAPGFRARGVAHVTGCACRLEVTMRLRVDFRQHTEDGTLRQYAKRPAQEPRAIPVSQQIRYQCFPRGDNVYLLESLCRLVSGALAANPTSQGGLTLLAMI